MHEGEDFSTKNVLKKHFFIVKMTCPAMVRPANSDYWKLSLSNDLSAINHVSNMYHYRCTDLYIKGSTKKRFVQPMPV